MQSGVLGHKIINDTKSGQLQDARDSGPSSGTRTGGKQVRGRRRSTSPKSGETGGTRKTSRPRVKLTDAEAIEAQCVENLQREDIHPLEEALGFKSLLELGEPAYTIATIGSRAGKSEAYVYGRVRLADLIPPVAEAFLKDQITIGHALLIAKLPASQQQEAFSAAFRGLWTSEGNSQVLIPVRELALCSAPHKAFLARRRGYEGAWSARNLDAAPVS